MASKNAWALTKGIWRWVDRIDDEEGQQIKQTPKRKVVKSESDEKFSAWLGS